MHIEFCRIRLTHSNGEKWIRPMYLNGHGYEIGEPEFPNRKPLYKTCLNLSAVPLIQYGLSKASGAPTT